MSGALHEPPAGLRVEESMDQLTIHFPATSSLTTRPLNRLEKWLSRLIISVPYIGLTLLGVLISGDAVVLAMAAGAALTYALGAALPDRRRVRVAHPAASATLTPHHLRLTEGRSEQTFPLDQIDKVTADAAGARLRYDNRNHYLMPARPAEERAWLVEAIQQAVRRRQESATDAEEDKRKLASLLKQRT